MNVSVRMTRTLLLMPEPHGQNQQRNGTKPPTESGTLLMYLEVGHWGLQACYPDCLPRLGMMALDSREGRYATALILDISGVDRRWAPAQGDRGCYLPFSVIDF